VKNIKFLQSFINLIIHFFKEIKIKQKYRYRFWTKEEIEKLVSLYKQGFSISEIEKSLTQRTEKAITCKLKALRNKVKYRKKLIPLEVQANIILEWKENKLSHSEIAKKYGININSVKTILYRKEKKS